MITDRRVVAAEPLEGMRVRLRFRDGTCGEVDLGARLAPLTGMMPPLGDPSFFKRLVVNHDAGTIVWPNGVDLDPDVLYELTVTK